VIIPYMCTGYLEQVTPSVIFPFPSFPPLFQTVVGGLHYAVFIYIHIYEYIRIFIYMKIYVYTYIFIYKNIYSYIYIYIHIHKHIFIYINVPYIFIYMNPLYPSVSFLFSFFFLKHFH
jgi:hypothetical protein